MKKALQLWALVALIAAPLMSRAQVEVLIGNPDVTTTQYTVPVNMYYNYSLTQQIYTADEIGMAGNITSISFDYANSSSFTMEGVQLYMMNVDKETFASTTDMVQVTSSDLVWQGTFSATQAGWVTISLDVPFAYDGVSNLLVCFYDPTNGYPGTAYKFRTTATTGYQSIAYNSDSYSPNVNDVSSFSGGKNRYLYRNNIQLGIVASGATICAKPTTLNVFDITAEGANLSWSGTDAGLYQVETKTAADTVWSVWAPQTDTTFSLFSLTPNTAYDVRVKALCSDSLESSYKTVNFRTSCAPLSEDMLPYVEDFEEYGTGSSQPISPCWTKATNGTTAYPYPYTSAAINGTRGLYFYGSHPSSATSTMIYSWAALPPVDESVDITNLMLTFNAKRYSSSSTTYHSTIKVGIAESIIDLTSAEAIDSMVTWMGLYDLTPEDAGTIVEERLSFANYQGNGKYVVFYCPTPELTSGTYAYNYIYLDDVVLRNIPTCPDVTGLAATNISSESATLTWNYAADSYTIYMADGSALAIVSDTTYTIDDLVSSTNYTFSVAANCGSEQGQPSSFSFRTACDAVSSFPWSDDFDDYASGDFSNPCWVNVHLAGAGNQIFKVYTGTNGSNSTQQLQLPDMTSGTMTKLMLPLMDIPGNNYLFSIDVFRNASGTSYPEEGVRVFASTNGEIEGATELGFISRNFTQTDNGIVPAEASSGWYTYEFPIPYSGNCYIILRGESKYGNSTYMDNFIVKEAPSCMKPTMLVAGNIVSDGLTLSWNDDINTNATYNIYVDSLLWFDNIQGTTFTFNGVLDANTQYLFSVQAACADGMSEITSISARTTCVPLSEDMLPYVEDFEEYASGSSQPISPCWRKGTNSTVAYPYPSSSAAINGSLGLYFYGNHPSSATSTMTYCWAALPPVDESVDITNLLLTFNAKRYNSTSTYYQSTIWVGIAESVEALTSAGAIDSLVVWMGLYDLTPEDASTIVEERLTFTNYQGNGKYIVFYCPSPELTSGNYAYNYIYIDDIVLRTIPSCPDVTGLAVSNTTAESVTLSWDYAADYYTIYNMADGTTLATTADSLFTVTGLAPTTSYTLGVAANCGSEQGQPSVITVRTACGPVSVPYTCTFEDDDANATPLCWTKEGSGSAVVVNSTYNSHSGSMYLKFSGSTSNLILLPPTEADINTLQLRFWTRPENYNSAYCGTFSVGYMVDTSFVELANYLFSDFTDYEEKVVNFTNAPSGARIAMRHNAGSNNYYWYVDDLTLVQAPSCPEPILITEAVSACESYFWNGQNLIQSGTYNAVLQGASGCDSLISTLNLVVNQPVHNYVTLEADDSLLWNNVTFTESGVYTFYFTAANGCDSAVTLNLTINATCTGNYCNITIVGNDSFGDGWNGNAIEVLQAGNTIGTFTLESGSDFTAHFSVCSSLPVSFYWLNGSYPYETSFQILDGGGTVVYSGSGAQTGTFLTLDNACPSCLPVAGLTASSTANSVTLYWNVDSIASDLTYNIYTDSILLASGVNGNYYVVNNLAANTPYSFSVQAVCSDADLSSLASVSVRTACDGISHQTLQAEACGSYYFENRSFTESGLYADTIYDEYGCLVARSLALTIFPEYYDTLTVNATNYYVWYGDTIVGDGLYPHIGQTLNGCDSIQFLLLSVNYEIACPDGVSSLSAKNADNRDTVISYIPGYSLYNYSYSEVIIPAERLEGLGTIKALQFKPASVTGGNSFTNCELYLANTSNADLSNSFIADRSGFQLVWSGDMNYSSTDWQTLMFSSPFVWDGSSNVVVAVIRNHGSWASGSSFEAYNADAPLARYVYTDNNPYSISSVSGGTAINRPAWYKLLGCNDGAVISCARIQNPSAEATSSSVTLQWNDPLNSGATYNIYIDTTLIAADIADTFYLVDNLESNTNYLFGIEAICAEGDLSSLARVNARTLCGPVSVPYTWTFEDDDASASPLCWTKEGAGSANVTNSASVSHSGSMYLKFSGSANNLILLPPTEADINTLQLRFWTRPESASNASCGSFSVGYMVDTAFVELANYLYSDFTDYTEKVVNFTNAPSGARIAMRHNAASTNWYWYVDDVTLIEAPLCGDVIQITEEASACGRYTWNGQTFTQSGTYTSTLQTANGCDSLISTLLLVVNQPVSVVQTEVAEGSYTWNGVTYTESGTYSYTTVAANGCDSTTILYLTINTACNGSYCNISIVGNDSYGDGWNNGYISVMQAGNLLGTFAVDNSEASISFSVCGDYPVSFTWTGGYYDGEVSFVIYDGGGAPVYTCPDATSLAASFFTLNNACPSCFAVSNLTATSTAESISLSWSDAGDALAFNVSMDGETIATGIADTFYTVYNLAANTAHILSVQALCTTTDTSGWVSLPVRTQCGPIASLPYTMGFEAAELQGSDYLLALPWCWTRINDIDSGASNNYFPYVNSWSDAYQGSKSLYFYAYESSYSTYADTTGFVLPALDVTTYPMNGNRVSFWAKVSSYYGNISYTLLVGTMTDPADMSTFSPVESVVVDATEFTKYTVSLAAAGATDAYVAVVVPKVNGTMYLDELTLEEMPACADMRGLRLENVTESSATLSWNAVAESYTVFLNGSEILVTDTTYTLTNLSAASSYTVGVAANCGSSLGLTSELTFTTSAIPATLPYATGFEAGEDADWLFVNGTNGWMIGSDASYSGAKALYVSNDGWSNSYNNGQASVSYAYRTLSFEAGGSYVVSFDWRSVGESGYDYLRAWIVPAGMQFVAGNYPDNAANYENGYTPAGWLALGGVLVGEMSWQHVEQRVSVSEGGYYDLVLMWRNDGSWGSNPPAAVDNVRVTAYEPVSVADATIGAEEIVYWTGSGANEAVMAVNWADTALAWGYRWDGGASVGNMLAAIAAEDPRLSYEAGDWGVNSITFDDGDAIHTSAADDWWWVNVNGSGNNNGINQTLADGDFVKWGLYSVGVPLDSMYGYPSEMAFTMAIQPVSAPSDTVYLTASACDSYRWSVGGEEYYLEESGVWYYRDTATGRVYYLNLTVNHSSETYLYDTAYGIYEAEWGYSYNYDFYYYNRYTNAGGCDSVVYHYVTVLPLENEEALEVTSCGCYWAKSRYLCESGTYDNVEYYDEGNNLRIGTVVLTVNEPYYRDTTVATREDYYVFNGDTLTQSGWYEMFNTGENGCDSNIYLHLQFVRGDTVTATACDQYCDEYWNCFYESGTYTVDYWNDSVSESYVLQLTLNRTTYSTTTVDVVGTTYEWHGMELTEPGYYTYTLTGSNGCDSVEQLQLRFVSGYKTITVVYDTAMGTVTGGGEYEEYESFTLTATPREGYLFQRWEFYYSDGSYNGSTTSNPFTFYAYDSYTVVAVFEAEDMNSYTLTVTKNGEGYLYYHAIEDLLWGNNTFTVGGNETRTMAIVTLNPVLGAYYNVDGQWCRVTGLTIDGVSVDLSMRNGYGDTNFTVNVNDNMLYSGWKTYYVTLKSGRNHTVEVTYGPYYAEGECLNVAWFSVYETTDNSAKMSWIAGSGHTYEITYGPYENYDFENGVFTGGAVTSTFSQNDTTVVYELTGLEANRCYAVLLKTVCDGDTLTAQTSFCTEAPYHTITVTNNGGSAWREELDRLDTTVVYRGSEEDRFYTYLYSHLPEADSAWYGRSDRCQLHSIVIDGNAIDVTRSSSSEEYYLEVGQDGDYVWYYLDVYFGSDHTVEFIFGPYDETLWPAYCEAPNVWIAERGEERLAIAWDAADSTEYIVNFYGEQQLVDTVSGVGYYEFTGLTPYTSYTATVATVCPNGSLRSTTIGLMTYGAEHTITVTNNGGLTSDSTSGLVTTATYTGNEGEQFQTYLYTMSAEMAAEVGFDEYNPNRSKLQYIVIDGNVISVEESSWNDDYSLTVFANLMYDNYVYSAYELNVNYNGDHTVQYVFGPWDTVMNPTRTLTINKTGEGYLQDWNTYDYIQGSSSIVSYSAQEEKSYMLVTFNPTISMDYGIAPEYSRVVSVVLDGEALDLDELLYNDVMYSNGYILYRLDIPENGAGSHTVDVVYGPYYDESACNSMYNVHVEDPFDTTAWVKWVAGVGTHTYEVSYGPYDEFNGDSLTFSGEHTTVYVTSNDTNIGYQMSGLEMNTHYAVLVKMVCANGGWWYTWTGFWTSGAPHTISFSNNGGAVSGDLWGKDTTFSYQYYEGWNFSTYLYSLSAEWADEYGIAPNRSELKQVIVDGQPLDLTGDTTASWQLSLEWSDSTYTAYYFRIFYDADHTVQFVYGPGAGEVEYDTVMVEQTVCGSYAWELSGETYTETGIYTYTAVSTNVETTYILNLTVNEATHEFYSDTACDSYTWNGTPYSVSGVYTYSYTNEAGCASVDTLQLTVNHNSSTLYTETACDSYTWNNTPYSVSGTYTYSYTNEAGCASVDTLQLTVNQSTSGSEVVTACNSYVWHGREFFAATDTATYTTVNAAGCDSTVTLHLTINQCSTTEITACDSYEWHGVPYSNSGIFIDGNDTLVLTINRSTRGIEVATACNSYVWHGTTYTESTITTDTTENVAGCDSITTLYLTVNECSTTEITACDSYEWNNLLLTSSGVYTLGNDTLILTINRSTRGIEVVNACNSYEWHGTVYTSSINNITYTTTNAAGCDSIATLYLTVNQCSTTEAVACDSYEWNGSVYNASGTYIIGNDTLILTINRSNFGDTIAQVCGSYNWYEHSGLAIDTTVTHHFVNYNQAGCDSIVTLHLTVFSCSTTEATACDSYQWHGNTYTSSGIYRIDHDTLILTINRASHGDTIARACGIYNWYEHLGMTADTTVDHAFAGINRNGCDSVVTLHLIVNDCSTTEAVACDSYVWEKNGQTYTSSGVFRDGYDTLRLTINRANHKDIFVTSCGSYDWYDYSGLDQSMTVDHTFPGANRYGCDSIVSLHLTITECSVENVTACNLYVWHNMPFTSSSTYVYGSDTLHLTINRRSVGDTLAIAYGSYDWYGNHITETGTYDHILAGANQYGCDSTVSLLAIILEQPASVPHLKDAPQIVTYTGCDSVFVPYNGGQIRFTTSRSIPSILTGDSIVVTVNHSNTGDTIAQACGSFDWYGHNYTESGTMTHTFAGANQSGCDSVVTMHLTINQCSTLDTTVCGQFTWHGQTFRSSTVWNDGNDTLILTVNQPSTGDTTAEACGSFDWYEHMDVTESGNLSHVFTNAAGCDSTVTLHLTINQCSKTDTTVCGSYTWNGHVYRSSGIYKDGYDTLVLNVKQKSTGDTLVSVCGNYDWYEHLDVTESGDLTHIFTNAVGCDSTVTLHLTVNSCSTTDIETCGAYVWKGSSYNASGTYIIGNDTLNLTIKEQPTGDTTAAVCGGLSWYEHEFLNQNTTVTHTFERALGCDSIVTLHLTVYQCSTTEENTCDSYEWHNNVYNQSGTFVDGHDTLKLTIRQSTTGVETATACNMYNWYGQIFTESTNTATHVVSNAAGCDSTITLHLTVNQCSSTDLTVCDSVIWHNVLYTQSGTYVDDHDTLHLTVNPTTTGVETVTACNSYDWYDYTGLTASCYNLTHTFVAGNQYGCDSIVTLNLTINHCSTEQVITCDSYDWHGTTYTQSGTYTDGTDTLVLTINHSVATTENVSANNSYTWHGTTYTQSGTYTWSGYTSAGCDSTVTLHLTITNGIDDVEKVQFNVSIYPNPTQGLVNIEANSAVSKVEVYDINGRKVAIYDNTSIIDLTHMATGTYTMRIHTQLGTAIKRVILK